MRLHLIFLVITAQLPLCFGAKILDETSGLKQQMIIHFKIHIMRHQHLHGQILHWENKWKRKLQEREQHESVLNKQGRNIETKKREYSTYQCSYKIQFFHEKHIRFIPIVERRKEKTKLGKKWETELMLKLIHLKDMFKFVRKNSYWTRAFTQA